MKEKIQERERERRDGGVSVSLPTQKKTENPDEMGKMQEEKVERETNRPRETFGIFPF